jgi:hypothetical protein
MTRQLRKFVDAYATHVELAYHFIYILRDIRESRTEGG